MIMPMPMVLWISDDGEEYIVPRFVEGLGTVSLVLICIGLVGLLVAITSYFIFDRETDRVFRLSFITMIAGMVLLLSFVIAMILTGQPVEVTE